MVQDAQDTHAAYQELVQTALRLQNRYWDSVKHETDDVPPLRRRSLRTRPMDAVAHVAAVARAATGDMDALCGEGPSRPNSFSNEEENHTSCP
ncbi:hypothetical protein GCM10009736_10290 [Actinomadura bangladeshensis]